MGLFDSFKSNKAQTQSTNVAVDPQKAQVVINVMSDGTAIVDANGTIQLFNPAAEALTGWKAKDAVSLNYKSIFNLYNNAGKEIDDNENPIIQAFKTRQAIENDKVYIETVSTKRIQILIKVTPIIESTSDGTQSVTGLVIVFRDITRERAIQNAQTDFISTASHEMRTPVATIEGYIGMSEECYLKIMSGDMKKGDVLSVARIAGIMGAKRTSELIPLCHIINLTKVTVDFLKEAVPDNPRENMRYIKAVCRTKCEGKTGVEMEALTGVSTALLTVYDMCKAVDRAMEITEIHLVNKKGGKSGEYIRKQ